MNKRKIFAIIGSFYIVFALGVIACVVFHSMTLYVIFALLVVACVAIDSAHLEQRLSEIEKRLEKAEKDRRV